jgi:putative membrane protein
MRLQQLTALVLGLGLISLFGCERQEGSKSTGYRDPKKEPKTDAPQASSVQSFLTNIAECNLAETGAGKTAKERANSPEVRKFAQQMLDDHGRVDSELSDLARRTGVTLPEQAGDAHRKELARLSEADGAEFDRRYVAMILGDHVNGLAMLQEKARLATDKDVRDFAERTLSRCQGHLKTARDLSAQLGPPSAD